MEGTLEASDELRFEIYDVAGDLVLSSLSLADDDGSADSFSIGDNIESVVSVDNVGLTDVQARIVYVGGFTDGDQEEIQSSPGWLVSRCGSDPSAAMT